MGLVTQWCTHYFGPRGCERGHYCTFAHSKDQLGKPYIERARYAKTNKMVLCRHWSNRLARPAGRDCPFAHGASELGAPRGCVGKAPHPRSMNPILTGDRFPRYDGSELGACARTRGQQLSSRSSTVRPPPGFPALSADEASRPPEPPPKSTPDKPPSEAPRPPGQPPSSVQPLPRSANWRVEETTFDSKTLDLKS